MFNLNLIENDQAFLSINNNFNKLTIIILTNKFN